MTLRLMMIAALLLVGCLATAAVLSRHYEDSLAQRLGLSIVAITTLARAVYWMRTDEQPALEVLVGVAGLAMYAVGTALKVVRTWSLPDSLRRRRTDRPA